MGKGLARVAIIGAGYAGLAAAVELADRRVSVTVFEAARALGGRARRVERHGLSLDNGQHILVGAYGETLRLMRRVGVDPDQALRRLPLSLHYPGRLRLRAPRWPAPLHLAWALATAKGVAAADKLAAMQFMNCLRAAKFRLGQDMSVAELLDDHGQSGDLRQLVWEPLCLASLNTPPALASARVFLNVLRDTLGGRRAASDLLLPRCDLSALLPDAAAAFLRSLGTDICTGTTVRRIAIAEQGFQLNDADDPIFSHAIIAVAPHQALPLIATVPALDSLRQTLAALSYEPIVTCYLACSADVSLPEPMIGMAQGIVQWLFDRGQLDGPRGLLAAVISAGGRHQALSHEALGALVCEEVSSVLGRPIRPEWMQVIEEKRATFACMPGANRPQCATPVPNLFLAGDYVASDYPATLESAVRSGVRAAELVSASLGA